MYHLDDKLRIVLVDAHGIWQDLDDFFNDRTPTEKLIEGPFETWEDANDARYVLEKIKTKE